MKNTIQDISSLGGNPVYFIAAFLFLITNHIREFWILTLAFVIAYLLTAGIRIAWWTERPDHQKFNNLWQKFDSGSFPSLHSARVTIIAITAAAFYHNIWAYIVFAIAILAVCWARVFLKRHRLVDVAVGTLFGLIIAALTPQIINALGIV